MSLSSYMYVHPTSHWSLLHDHKLLREGLVRGELVKGSMLAYCESFFGARNRHQYFLPDAFLTNMSRMAMWGHSPMQLSEMIVDRLHTSQTTIRHHNHRQVPPPIKTLAGLQLRGIDLYDSLQPNRQARSFRLEKQDVVELIDMYYIAFDTIFFFNSLSNLCDVALVDQSKMKVLGLCTDKFC